MKQSAYHIICSWVLLVLFTAGQIAIYSHVHKEEMVAKIRHQTSRQSISEKCQLCDAMHHNAIILDLHTYSMPVVASTYHYKDVTYNFVSISLILAAGRAPPIS